MKMVLLMVKIIKSCHISSLILDLLLVWDVRANGCRFSLKKTEDSINSMITIDNCNNQPTLACTSSDGTVTIIDLSTKQMVIQVF